MEANINCMTESTQ